jgi:hypothetical protein
MPTLSSVRNLKSQVSLQRLSVAPGVIGYWSVRFLSWCPFCFPLYPVVPTPWAANSSYNHNPLICAMALCTYLPC